MSCEFPGEDGLVRYTTPELVGEGAVEAFMGRGSLLRVFNTVRICCWSVSIGLWAALVRAVGSLTCLWLELLPLAPVFNLRVNSENSKEKNRCYACVGTSGKRQERGVSQLPARLKRCGVQPRRGGESRTLPSHVSRERESEMTSLKALRRLR